MHRCCVDGCKFEGMGGGGVLSPLVPLTGYSPGSYAWPPCGGLLRGLSQIIFPTVSVIMTLRGGGGGGSEGVTLIFYLRHTLTFGR